MTCRADIAEQSSTSPHLQAMLSAFHVGAERFDEAALPLGDEHGLAVAAAEGEVGRLLGLERDLANNAAVRRQNGDAALENAGDEQTAAGVGAQAVDGVGFEGFDQLRPRQRVAVDRVGPDLAAVGFANIERAAGSVRPTTPPFDAE